MQQAILQHLAFYAPGEKIPDDELPCIIRAIEDLQQRGWLPSEITSKLRWLEHVDPIVDEDTALRNMRRVDERVAERMKKQS